MDNSGFRIVIVGGGPVGLIMAHMLSKADIDFVLLERRPSISEDVGASLALTPSGLRVLAQLGLLDGLLATGVGMQRNISTTKDGRVFRSLPTLGFFKDYCGCDAHAFDRAWLTQALYDALSEHAKSRVFTDKKVVDVATDDAGVAVHCVDGTRYGGSIVVGAEGVHSIVRQRIQALARDATRTSSSVEPSIADTGDDDGKSFSCEYRTLWCSFPAQPSLHEPGTQYLTHGWDYVVQLLAGRTKSWLFLHERLAATATGAPEVSGRNYSVAEAAAPWERWEHLPLVGEDRRGGEGEDGKATQFRLRDALACCYRAGAANVEEGVARRWTWGRAAIVGDAAHKFSPSQGLGFSCGVQDAAALTNEVRRVTRGAGHGAKGGEDVSSPSVRDPTAVLERYQEARRERAEYDNEISARTVRLSAWRNTISWLFSYWVLPLAPGWLSRWILRYSLGDSMRRAVVLDFLEGEEPFVGSVPWVHPIPKPVPPASSWRA
ncbi:FAD/NAD(P)-binding domain-containing protein [Durotheca rogersii]|uniref:FAD/NAD(P)-binding domain-containing protein n=1 Tax=Durotheca rogersii TaxID=419775 RepID=UPI00221E5DE3|nr:FAD/NAD(P)-binding domain-containing protein [Durotheca rogersii]KAI5862625.1 FAD/NAD(P)-binding domain-containing protein [Durotheca rogersii]